MKVSEPFSFQEQLEFGKRWEEYATERLETLLTSISMRNIDYETEPELQRAGIDSILSRSEPSIDIKTQKYEYTKTGNLPIETMSVEEESIPGWFYTSDSDLIVWVYPNQAATNLYQTGYFMPHTEALRDWFNDQINQFTRKRIPNEGYHTAVRLVPIESFPDEFLVEFDPRLPTDRETPQSDIMKWAGSDP